MAGQTTTLVTHEQPSPSVGRIVYDFVADDATANFAAVALPSDFDGRLLAIVTNPDTPAPTDNYDVTLLDADGFDLLGGAGANRDTATTERAAITDGYVSRYQTKTLGITDGSNLVNSAKTRVELLYTHNV